MTALPACIALLTIIAAGAGLLALLPVVEMTWIEAAPLAWLLGCVFVSLSMALLGIVLHGLLLQGMITAICLVLGGLALRALRKGSPRVRCPVPAGSLEWLLCAVLALECALVISMAVHRSLGWDGLLVWEVKARYAFLNGGAVPAGLYTDQMRSWMHPEYPLLFPLVETWLYLWIGDCDQSWVRILFPLFYMAGMLVLCAAASRLSGKRWAGPACAALLFFVPLGQQDMLAGYADFPLAVFYVAAVVYYLRYVREGRAGHLILFSILSGAMPWLKREGAILWFCAMAIAITDLLRRKEFRLAVCAPLPGLVAILGWKIAMSVLKEPPVTEYLPATLTTLHNNFHRILPIATAAVRELGKLDNWSVLWYVFPVAIASLAIRGKVGLSLRIFVAAALPIGLYSAVFVFSAWGVYMNHLHLSLPRLVLQVAPVAVLGIALAVAAGTMPISAPTLPIDAEQ